MTKSEEYKKRADEVLLSRSNSKRVMLPRKMTDEELLAFLKGYKNES